MERLNHWLKQVELSTKKKKSWSLSSSLWTKSYRKRFKSCNILLKNNLHTSYTPDWGQSKGQCGQKDVAIWQLELSEIHYIIDEHIWNANHKTAIDNHNWTDIRNLPMSNSRPREIKYKPESEKSSIRISCLPLSIYLSIYLSLSLSLK